MYFCKEKTSVTGDEFPFVDIGGSSTEVSLTDNNSRRRKDKE